MVMAPSHDHADSYEFPLVGPGGERIDLWRTLTSHGMTSLPPMQLDEERQTLEVTLSVNGRRPRTVRIHSPRPGYGELTFIGRKPGPRMIERLLAKARHLLRLDEDLSPFYALASEDPALTWVTGGAGRMMRSASVFEDVIKTICTTNCVWSATVRMVRALCEHLGNPAPGAPKASWQGRAFPTPQAMASADEEFYRRVVRAGYRSRYLREIALSVSERSLDLEALGAVADELPDHELEKRLLALPGVGSYAASHIMMTMGRYSRLTLDSWSRPKFARLLNKEAVEDEQIERRFACYGRYAGLAFWLFLTEDWVDK
jgi:3-methyladenine DNA glycosylase/8-oxoguanine DNA glycosylase